MESTLGARILSNASPDIASSATGIAIEIRLPSMLNLAGIPSINPGRLSETIVCKEPGTLHLLDYCGSLFICISFYDYINYSRWVEERDTGECRTSEPGYYSYRKQSNHNSSKIW
jgi:hypothetical protein